MSTLVSRILLSLLMIPAAAIVYLLAFVLLESTILHNDETALAAAGLITWLFVATYWFWLWWSTVRWHVRRRIPLTFLSAFGAVIAGVAVGVAMGVMMRGPDELTVFTAGVVTILSWLIGTVLIWRETDDERGSRLRGGDRTVICPACTYNMTGLSESVCPECGARYTLEELLYSQRQAASVED